MLSQYPGGFERCCGISVFDCVCFQPRFNTWVYNGSWYQSFRVAIISHKSNSEFGSGLQFSNLVTCGFFFSCQNRRLPAHGNRKIQRRCKNRLKSVKWSKSVKKAKMGKIG